MSSLRIGTHRFWCRALLVCLAVLLMSDSARAQVEADRAWESGDLVTAERLYGERLAADSNDVRALHRLALLYAWSERYQRSLALFDRLVGISPENIDARIDRARVSAWSGDNSGAVRQIEAVTAEHPTYLPALKARAQFLSWAGEYADAVATYDRIIQITPEDVTVRRDQARVLAWGQQYEVAAAIYQRILDRDPGNLDALLDLGRLLSWSDQLDSAEVVFEHVMERDPGNLEALRGHARVAAWADRLIEAESRWRHALERSPQDVETLVGLATTLRWQGRDAAAFRVVNRALELDPTDGDARTQLDWVQNAMRPRVGTGVTYEADSDDNRMLLLRLRSAWRPVPRLELQVETYRRDADNVGPNPLDRHAMGAKLSSMWQFEPGWNVHAGLGVAKSNAAGTEPQAALSASLVTPGRHRVRGNISYTRAPVEATASIIENDVRSDEIGLGATVKLSPLIRGYAGTSWSRFKGVEANRRLAGNIGISWRLAHMFTIGSAVRTFGFSKDLGEGYFDPDFYGLLEGSVRWHGEWGTWLSQLEVAPGLEKVRAAGTVKGTVRTFARVGYTLAPGRDLQLSGGFSTSGLRIASGNTDYRYWTIGLGANWRF